MSGFDIKSYNESMTPEERAAHASKAASAKRPNRKRNSDLRRIANIINSAPAPETLREALEALNIDMKDPTNAAGIVVSVYQSAINGDMKAVEKWEQYIGQAEPKEAQTAGPVVNIICDIPKVIPEIPAPGGDSPGPGDNAGAGGPTE